MWWQSSAIRRVSHSGVPWGRRRPPSHPTIYSPIKTDVPPGGRPHLKMKPPPPPSEKQTPLLKR